MEDKAKRTRRPRKRKKGNLEWLADVLGLTVDVIDRASDFARQYTELSQGIGSSEVRHREPPTGVAFTAYDVFELPKDAGEEQFKRRYRELMGKVHRDHGGSDALAKMINTFWEQIRKDKGWR